jgi:hypothetical protein
MGYFLLWIVEIAEKIRKLDQPKYQIKGLPQNSQSQKIGIVGKPMGE